LWKREIFGWTVPHEEGTSLRSFPGNEIVGAFLGDVGRYLLAATLVIGLGLVLGFRPTGGVVGVLLALVLVLVFAFSLSWIFTVLGLIMRTPSAVMSVGTVVLFPLTFASNVFVNPQTMPGWLQAFINVNPISHLVTAARSLMMHGTVAAGQVGWVLLASAALTMYLYRNKR
jgi:ABC-2 type transport system permease protein